MADIVKKNQERIILAEIQAGIDPDFTDLIANPGEYWLKDEADVVATTGYLGAIPGNMWTVNGGILETDSTGTDSEYWEFDGAIMQAVI